MLSIFNTIFDVLIRNLDYTLRCTIGLALFALSAYCLTKSIRKKDDKHPIAWGWFILCFICMLLSVLYIAV